MDSSRTRIGKCIFPALLSAFTLHPSSLLLAQPPGLINYQGRLVQGTNLVNDAVGLTLRLFNASSGGTMVYADSNQVTVVDGLYATVIGDGTISGALDNALTNAQVWLEAVVNGTVLTPRERLVAVPYARAVHGLKVDANTVEANNRNFAVRRSNTIARLDLSTSDAFSDSLIQFSDLGNTNIALMGWDVSAQALKITTAADLSSSAGISMSSGTAGSRIGIGGLPPTNHKVFINYNSSSNNAHLTLRENNNGDYSRMSFVNFGATGLWTIAAITEVPPAFNPGMLHFNYDDGTGGKDILSVDGGDQRVGINVAAPQATLDVGGSLRVGGGSSIAGLQAGTALLGPGTNTQTYSVNFPTAFSTTPNVIATPRNDPAFSNVNDTFATTIRRVTVTNFVVNVVRVDAAAGWAQTIRLGWMAWE